MNFATMKHKMDTLFHALLQTAETGDLPSTNNVRDFLFLAEKMHFSADESWHNESEDFLHLTRQLQKVVKQGNFQETVRLIDALHDAREFCHQSFRG